MTCSDSIHDDLSDMVDRGVIVAAGRTHVAWVNLLNAGRVRVYYQISIIISDIIYVLIICNFF